MSVYTPEPKLGSDDSTLASALSPETRSAEALHELQPTPATQVDKSSPDSVQDEPTTSEFSPGWRFYLAFLSLCVVTMAAALDASSISVALPIMAQKLDGSAIQTFWSGTSFLVTSTVFQPSFASLSHIFGRKPFIFVALVFFAVGAIIAAVAGNFTVILVGRSLQGIGAGGIIALTEVVVSDMVPLKERGKHCSLGPLPRIPFLIPRFTIREVVWFYFRYLGYRFSQWPYRWRRVRSRCVVALDLLDQYTHHWRWRDPSLLFPESPTHQNLLLWRAAGTH